MEIVRMDSKHVPGIADLEKCCFNDPWSENSIASELKNALSYWLVATEQEKVIGYVGSQTVLGGADMMNIAVSPDHRRKGIARKLIEQLIVDLKERGAVCLVLEVRASNVPAISLYESMGFSQIGRRPNYYRHPKEDALILRKEWSN